MFRALRYATILLALAIWFSDQAIAYDLGGSIDYQDRQKQNQKGYLPQYVQSVEKINQETISRNNEVLRIQKGQAGEPLSDKQASVLREGENVTPYTPGRGGCGKECLLKYTVQGDAGGRMSVSLYDYTRAGDVKTIITFNVTRDPKAGERFFEEAEDLGGEDRSKGSYRDFDTSKFVDEMKDSITYFTGRGASNRATHSASNLDPASGRAGQITVNEYMPQEDGTYKMLKSLSYDTTRQFEDFANPKTLAKLTENELVSIDIYGDKRDQRKKLRNVLVSRIDPATGLTTEYDYVSTDSGFRLSQGRTMNSDNQLVTLTKFVNISGDDKVSEVFDALRGRTTSYAFEGRQLISSKTVNSEGSAIQTATFTLGADGDDKEKSSTNLLTGITTQNYYDKINDKLISADEINAQGMVISSTDFTRAEFKRDIPTLRTNLLTNVIEKYVYRNDGASTLSEVQTFGPPNDQGERALVRTDRYRMGIYNKQLLDTSTDELLRQTKTFKYDDKGKLTEALTVSETGDLISKELYERGPDGNDRVKYAESYTGGEWQMRNFSYSSVTGALEVATGEIRDGGVIIGSILERYSQGPDGSDHILDAIFTRGNEQTMNIYVYDENGLMIDMQSSVTLLDISAPATP